MHTLIGLIVVAVLIAGFVLGAHLHATETPPPLPHEQPRRPITDRMPGAAFEFRRTLQVPRSNQKQRLRPYQLRARTEQVPPGHD
ncbi:DUF6479 family protein [Streptomyces sp. NPDC093089]|uniref:DUF6479 family protein n=1 Tax=Streptomyces sp. NPDC093089 TaxID=3366024 RepID=UPI003830EEA5